MAMSAYGQGRRGGRGERPQLTDEQKSCLEGILGVRGQGERPSREQKKAAAEQCGLEKPNRQQGSSGSQTEMNNEQGRQHLHQFTEDQEYCLEDILGPRGQVEKPTLEEMQAAASECGIQEMEAPVGEESDLSFYN